VYLFIYAEVIFEFLIDCPG